MTVTLMTTTGNSSKFQVVSKQGSCIIALSFTLKAKIWKLADETAELHAAQELAEAIISRHDPSISLRPLYVFAEHNTDKSLEQTVVKLRKTGF